MGSVPQQRKAKMVNASEEVKSSDSEGKAAVTPLVSSFNDHIRPLLDAVDRLRQLKVTNVGIELPTIVVVGDQSSGKSSVLESLAGISLPRGQGICTRVPLVMRLQNDPSKVHPELILEYMGKTITTTEGEITKDICLATDVIAGDGKGIQNTPLTLAVKKNGVPDLTMVDLPGITRVPVRGQPENIYEQISEIIMQYITPKESIILNVISASVDFSTSESIRMSQQVDKSGERTLAVITKSDKAPEGLMEKVTADDVNIGLGYVCVRNRINDETYDDARLEEASLFKYHPLLSKIDKSIVGIPVLAEKLVKIQASSIARCLPDIVKKINTKMNNSIVELSNMPQKLATISDAMRAFMHVLGNTKESLRKILIRGEYDEFPEETDMHATARLASMLDKYSKELPPLCALSNDSLFLMEEIGILEECKDIGLPNFLPRTAFLLLLQKKIKEISAIPVMFIERVWAYIEAVVMRVLLMHTENYQQLKHFTTRAVKSLLERLKSNSLDHVKLLVDMEMISDYTFNADYTTTWTTLMAQQGMFMNALKDHSQPTNLKFVIFGEIDVKHLRPHLPLAEQAFDMRVRLTAYWKCVTLRLVDGLALHLLFVVKNMVNLDIEKYIVDEIVCPGKDGLVKMLEEAPSTARKRERLKQRIELLKASTDVVADIMDRLVIQ